MVGERTGYAWFDANATVSESVMFERSQRSYRHRLLYDLSFSNFSCKSDVHLEFQALISCRSMAFEVDSLFAGLDPK